MTGDPALGEEVFDVPKAQAEPEVEPDGVGDDVGGEAIALMARGVAVHPISLIRRMASAMVSIGVAGTRDGILLSGVGAAYLA